MKKYLISGLGPTLMETEDLRGSLFDPECPQIQEYYTINGVSYDPRKLIIEHNGNQTPLLRPKVRLEQTDYISEVLKAILDDANIAYTFIPIAKIWENEDYYYNDAEPCVVCLSTTFMWNTQMIDAAVDWIYRNLNCCKLIIGGQYGVLKCDYIKNHLGNKVNYILTAEAELSLVPLLNHIDTPNSCMISEIPNMWFRSVNGDFRFTFESEYNYRNSKTVSYEGKTNYIPYMSMRGCPYNCMFCALRECTKKWQYLPAERIIADWDEYHKKNGASHFSINDSTFFIPFSKIQKLLDYLKERNYSWDANARSDTPFDKHLVDELQKTNCTALFFGFESMCDETLKKMDKRTTVADNRYINELFARSEINTKMSFIVGFPGETPEDYDKTREYLVREHVGRYSLYVFEYEGDILPISKEKEKYQLRLLDDKSDAYHWAHAGEHWSHIGMDSDTARALRKQTIYQTRTDPNSLAIFRTWQDNYQWPLVPWLSRKDNIIIEKLLDRIVYMMVDNPEHFSENVIALTGELRKYSIYLEGEHL